MPLPPRFMGKVYRIFGSRDRRWPARLLEADPELAAILMQQLQPGTLKRDAEREDETSNTDY